MGISEISIYKNQIVQAQLIPKIQIASESSYSTAMDKYLAGDFGYRPDRGGIQGNEDYYFRNSEQGISRPFKAILSMLNPKTQFFAGENESAPFVPFILIWIVFCSLVYLLIYGIQISIHRTNN